MKKTGPKKTVKAKRLSFPDDEKDHPWLSTLLEAFYIVDSGVAGAIEAEIKKGRNLACVKGCSNCCSTHRDIPVYPLELVGISWYATEKMTGHEREILRDQLENFDKQGPCPFLIKGVCSIHKVRPLACRQFNVFRRPCDRGEDPYYTRREDVLEPVREHVDQAFFIMLPFYSVEKDTDRARAVERGDMHKMARVMQDCNWKSLAEMMDKYDDKQKKH